MKQVGRFFLEKILAGLARLLILRYKPLIVAVSGSAGKTSAKEAMYLALLGNEFGVVRRTKKNYNTELGLPLTILSEREPRGVGSWMLIVLEGLARLIFFHSKYPKILILEYGADRPGDIEKLLRIVKPQISVLTAIGAQPVHMGNYPDGREGVIVEKGRLANVLSKNDTLIINGDDEALRRIAKKSKAKVITYGYGEGAAVRGIHYEVMREGVEVMVSFKVEIGRRVIPIKITGAYSEAHILSVLAALSLVEALQGNTVEAATRLELFRPMTGRGRVFVSYQDILLVDEAYNASPIAMQLAILGVEKIFAKRKIAVLGEMKELGEAAAEAHRFVGQMAANVFTMIVVVGAEMASEIVKGARKGGMAEKDIFEVKTVKEAKELVIKKIKKGDMLFVKGSRSVGLEKMVESFEN
ncbi:MAG: hypothetical protein FJY91_01715 [Candidatus Harrisonbacteria bacterium]|nr:hypothetical protein [Candidatus Harrisonbacteria bacterium]